MAGSNFLKNQPIIYLMSKVDLKCLHPAAKAVYKYLIRLGVADRLDQGFRVIDYRDPSNPKGILKEAGDGKVGCEELWENSFIILDELGQKPEAVQKYRALRSLIETQTKRPIPWVLEAPTVGVSFQRQRSLEKIAHQLRQKVLGAIDELNALLVDIKRQDETKYKRCLIACLYWFVLVGEDGKGEPLDDQKKPHLVSFLTRQGLSREVVDKIRKDFSEYLQRKRSGGGLGLADVGQKDAKFEATALETVIQKRGGCTEQSKVMYAVLRMAGIESFFVEPKLSVEYFAAKRRHINIPLIGHVASGVGIKIVDEKGKEGVWIVDVALKQLEADYIRKTDQWKAHPYWELSLRHFYMADLANLGGNQTGFGNLAGAGQSLATALQLGEDSTASYAMGNYSYLLSQRFGRFFSDSKGYKEIRERMDKDIDKYSKAAVEINPDDAILQLNRGIYLSNKKDWVNWKEIISAFLKSIDADPRYIPPY